MPPLIMNTDTPVLTDKPSDAMPQNDREDLTSIDEDDLRGYLLDIFKNDIADKQQDNFMEKKAYDVTSYYGLKNKALMEWPWEGASAFPVPLTPTLTDTAYANIHASKWSNDKGPVKVRGVGVEDIRTSKLLEDWLNWQVINEMEFESEDDKNDLRTFLHGTGFMKVFQDIKTNTVKIYSVDIENMYVPIDARGLQVGEAEHVVHIIPLSYSDLQMRKLMGVYKYPDEILPGVGISYVEHLQNKTNLMDIASGTSMETKNRRDTYYIGEFYCTYANKSGTGYGSNGSPSRVGVRPMEIIAWMSPHGGRIQRVRLNKSKIRPFADSHAYPYPDRFFSQSLPGKIRNEQEEIDYADKQNTDALDRAIMPAGFVDDTDAFDRTRKQRVPGGIYPKGKGNTIEWEPSPPVERGFERRIAQMWEQAERKTGIIDVTQGRPSAFGSKTLGEVEIRSARADVRFKAIYKRFERSFNKVMQLVYRLDNQYVPRDKKIKVLGYNDFKSIDELFPKNDSNLGLGMTGNFDFSFSSGLASEKEYEDQQKKEFCTQAFLNPLVQSDPANMWRITEMQAEAYGIRNIENAIQKPKEVNIFSVEEFLQRILSGQVDIQIRPGIDTESYLFELQLFMKTETFVGLDQDQQKVIFDALRRAFVMSAAERQAKMDLMRIQQMDQQMVQVQPGQESQGQLQ